MINDLTPIRRPSRENTFDGLPVSIVISIINLVESNVKQLNSDLIDRNRYQRELDILLKDKIENDRFYELQKMIIDLEILLEDQRRFLKSEEFIPKIISSIRGGRDVIVVDPGKINTGLNTDRQVDTNAVTKPDFSVEALYTELIINTLDTLLRLFEIRSNGDNPFKAIAQV